MKTQILVIPIWMFTLLLLSSCYPYMHHRGPYYNRHMNYDDNAYCGQMTDYSMAMRYSLDKNADGRISHDEWEDQFKAMDANGDGVITEKEWEAFRSESEPRR